jgi:hypothetical protein
MKSRERLAYERSVALLTGRMGPSGRVRRERRQFGVQVNVSGELMRQQPELARKFAQSMIDEQMAQPFRGPRGGTYVAEGEPYDYREHEDAYFSGQVEIRMLVVGRYVRPPRRKN